MLRRLPERHKCRALELLNGSSHSSYSALYGLPHRDDLVSIFFDLFYRIHDESSFAHIVLLFFRTLPSVGRQKKQLVNAKIWGRSCLDPSYFMWLQSILLTFSSVAFAFLQLLPFRIYLEARTNGSHQ